MVEDFNQKTLQDPKLSVQLKLVAKILKSQDYQQLFDTNPPQPGETRETLKIPYNLRNLVISKLLTGSTGYPSLDQSLDSALKPEIPKDIQSPTL
jgi:hypothetical protein